MRYIRYICIAVFAIALIIVSLANRNTVTLSLVPDELTGYVAAQPQVVLPLYVVIFGGILVGLALGYAAEYLREAKYRSEVKKSGKEMRRLARENRRLRAEKTENQGDEVLALLDEVR